MTREEEIQTVNATNADLVKRLADRGKRVRAVVSIVTFEDDEDSHVASLVVRRPDPGDERLAVGQALTDAADLLHNTLHANDLCAHCLSKREHGTLQ